MPPARSLTKNTPSAAPFSAYSCIACGRQIIDMRCISSISHLEASDVHEMF